MRRAATPLDRGSIDAIVASVLASRAGAATATAAPVDGNAGDGVLPPWMPRLLRRSRRISSIATAQCRIAPALLTAFASFPAGRDFARALDHGGGRDRNGKLCRQDGENRVAAQNSGVEDLITAAISGDGGLTLTEYSAYGVIGSITPTTNPTETIINNTLGMLAAGNAVVFSPHPRSRQVSLYCVTLINQQLARLGAPPVWWSRSPARRLTTPMP